MPAASTWLEHGLGQKGAIVAISTAFVSRSKLENQAPNLCSLPLIHFSLLYTKDSASFLHPSLPALAMIGLGLFFSMCSSMV